jgi:RNA polymerase sigma factor for flagellar operon FliA
MATDQAAAMLMRPGAEPGAPRPGPGRLATYCDQVDEAEAIRRYVPLVKRIATRLKARLPEAVQLDDLIQAGLIAVLRILRHGGTAPPADPALQRSIINAMIDEARREAWAPVRTVRLAKTAAQAMRAIKLRLGRDGADEEIAAEMGLELAEYHRALVEIAGIRLLQLDEFDDSDEDQLRVADDRDAALDRSRMLAVLTASIAALPEREKLVISLYYEQELNMEEVGEVLGLDKSTVCRAHGRALLMLRAALGQTADRLLAVTEG